MLGEQLGELQGKVSRPRILRASASMLCLALFLSTIAGAQAAELQVLAGGAMTAPMNEIATQFESATGHKLVFRFGTTPELIKLPRLAAHLTLVSSLGTCSRTPLLRLSSRPGRQPTLLG